MVLGPLTLLRWMQTVAPLFRAEETGSAAHPTREEADFAGLRFQSWLNRLLGGALEGLVQVDLLGFELRREALWEEAAAALLLDGEECTLHALAARHLGCTSVATLRPEMARVCELIEGGARALLGATAVLAAATRSAGARADQT
jgi:hypothetical protein